MRIRIISNCERMRTQTIIKVACFLVAIAAMITAPFTNTAVSSNNAKDSNTFVEYTHTVLGEYGTATWCGHCPPVSAALWSIYNEGTRDFVYVTLVADKNSVADQRCEELGLEGYPTVFYDGGYAKVVGESPSPDPEDEEARQEAAMDYCGQRTVPKIDLDLDVVWNGDATMTITLIANNEVIDTELTEKPLELTNERNVTFSWKATCGEASDKWHIRVYVTEIVSRWLDASGEPYHFGFLDYAINKDVTIGPGETYTETVEWDGAAHGYPDITQDNIMVIAAIFDSSGYSVQATSAVPSSKAEDLPSSDSREEILYSYILEGYDEDWSDWTTDTTVTYYNLEDGLYTFKVKAKVGDLEDQTPAEWTFRVDATPPDTTIISGPSGDINVKNVTFEWTGSDNYTPESKLLYSYMLEGFDENWSTWSPSKEVTYKDLPAGNFTFKVRAMDEAGNLDPTPATKGFNVLRPEPYTSIVSGPEGYINSRDVTFVWTGRDDTTPTEDLLYSYKLEGYDTNWSEWTGETTVTYTDLDDGEYTFMVRSKDKDGYIDPEPATRNFIIDTQKPEVKIESPLHNRLYIKGISLPFIGTWIISSSVDIEAVANDNCGIDHVLILINGEEKANISTPPYRWTWDEKGFGKYTITVEAYDLAGNREIDEMTVLKFF